MGMGEHNISSVHLDVRRINARKEKVKINPLAKNKKKKIANEIILGSTTYHNATSFHTERLSNHNQFTIPTT